MGKMANKFIYFLIIVVTCAGSIGTYFLSDDFETNLPERFGDPIEENWQDKRSAENEYSSFSRENDNYPNVNKESTDLDYRNGNAEQQADDEIEKSESFQKRESEMESKESVDEADVRQMFSQFSNSDRRAFDSLMNDQSPKIDLNKRQLLKQNFENSFHLNKRNNFKMPCKGLRCDETNQQVSMRKELNSEEDGYNNCPEKVNAKRKLKFKRSNHFQFTPRENILQAKISILKDNYKRSSEMRMLEDSAKRKYSKSKRKQDTDRGDR